MKKFAKLFSLLFLATSVSLFTACSDDDDNGNIIDPGNTNTIADFVADNPNYSSLLAALQQVGLDQTLAGSGPFTVFAPDNDAFDAFLNGAALADVPNDVLTNLLLNHVVSGNVTSSALTTGYINSLATEASTGANLSMYVDTSSGVVLNGISTVETPDIAVDNGVIHAVNTVIGLPTIVDFAVTNPNLSSLVAALTDEGNMVFTTLLSDTNADFTVFAPTNMAFDTFLDGAALSDVDNAVLAQVLSNHVVPGAVAVSTALSNSYVNTAASFQGNGTDFLSLYINTDSGVTLNGSSNVVIADVVAANGVIHVVDAVIGLPDVTTFATADPTFSTLVTALTREASFGYVAALQTPDGTTPAPFTVFAPTNDAFGNLLTDLGLSELADIPTATLETVLELHVVPETNVRAEDLAGLDGAAVPTLGGDNITINAGGPSIIGPDGIDNPIIVTNVQAANGVIHALGRVIR